jgi:hypothetical protein
MDQKVHDADKKSKAAGSSRSSLASSSPIPRTDFLRDSFYRTSDPKDSVFVLRDIIPEFANLEPDYASTPEQIFSVATETLLRNASDGLRGLQQRFHPQASPQLPSWIFDFTHCNSVSDENGHERFILRRHVNIADASAGSTFHVAACNKTSIHVAGFVFDRILDIGHSMDHTEQPDLRLDALLNNWVRLAHIHFQKRVAFRQELGTHTRALIRVFGSDHYGDFRLTLADLLQLGSVGWEEGPVKVLNALIGENSIVPPLENPKEIRRAAFFKIHLKNNARKAKFFVTEDFRMGLAPIGAAIGDRIAILASGNAPFILRPVSEDYAGEVAYRIIEGCEVEGRVTRHATCYSPC